MASLVHLPVETHSADQPAAGTCVGEKMKTAQAQGYQLTFALLTWFAMLTAVLAVTG
jgi:hypothetical protein